MPRPARRRELYRALRSQGLDSRYAERLALELADHLDCAVESLDSAPDESERLAREQLGAVETIARAVVVERVPLALALPSVYEPEHAALRWSMSIGTSAAMTSIALFLLQAIVLGA